MSKNDVKMMYIADDIQKIQTKPNLFLTKFGPAGCAHLCREIIQNAIDELLDKKSPGKLINIIFNVDTDTLICEDDGRGIPEDDYPLDIFFTKNQSGSKFFREEGNTSSGEFGVGNTVVSALSEKLDVTTYREFEKVIHNIKFELGNKVSDEKYKMNKSDKQHGCIIKFKPSKKYLGNNAYIPYKDVIDWIERMTYFIDEKSKMKIKVSAMENGNITEDYTFKPQPFKLLLNKIAINQEYSSLMSINTDGFITEKIRKINTNKGNLTIGKEVDIEKNVHLDVALRYVPEQITLYDSYCNFTNTTDGGVHIDTVERCFCNYMQNKTKSMMTDIQKNKYPILWDDVRSGLCCVVNLSTGAQVGFVGNAKTKIGNTELVPVITEMMNKSLDDFFTKNPSVLKEYTNIIKLNAKARIESEKIKTSIKTEKLDMFKTSEMDNYIEATSRNKNDELELFIIEGKSAGGAARNGSNPKLQAFLMVRGNTINPLKVSLSELMANKEVKTLVTVMGAGIGNTFNIKKLRFKRINIMTDADIDGYGISSGLLLLFYLYFRPIIEEGRLYKVFTPLYHVDDKTKPYIANKRELIDLYYKQMKKHYVIRRILDDRKMSKDEIIEFLLDTHDYQSNLIMVSNDCGHVYKYLIEAIIGYFTLLGAVDNEYKLKTDVIESNAFIKEFLSRIQVKFPEINIKGNTIFGIANGRRYRVRISDKRLKKCSLLIDTYRKYGYTLLVKENDNDVKELTVGELLDSSEKYVAKTLSRYKGLGELNGDELWETTLDINNRSSVQYTIEDVERELGIFHVLHGSSKKDMADRKQMMKEYKIDREDLDN